MPFLGLGLHILIALFFAVHAVRTGRPIYWLFILFSFPLLGSLVYFLVEFLPETRLNRDVGMAARTIAKSLNPGRELREARRAFDLSPTVQNRMRLAHALLAGARIPKRYEHCELANFEFDEVHKSIANATVPCSRRIRFRSNRSIRRRRWYGSTKARCSRTRAPSTAPSCSSPTPA